MTPNKMWLFGTFTWLIVALGWGCLGALTGVTQAFWVSAVSGLLSMYCLIHVD